MVISLKKKHDVIDILFGNIDDELKISPICNADGKGKARVNGPRPDLPYCLHCNDAGADMAVENIKKLEQELEVRKQTAEENCKELNRLEQELAHYQGISDGQNIEIVELEEKIENTMEAWNKDCGTLLETEEELERCQEVIGNYCDEHCSDSGNDFCDKCPLKEFESEGDE